MRAREFIFEDYKDAKKEFSRVADPALVQTTIDQYKELVKKNQFRNPAEKNIDHWRGRGWEAFSQMVKLKSSDITDTQRKRGKVVGEIITLQDDDEWLVLVPLDKEASVHYGRGTEWCTTKPQDPYYESYVYERNITLIYAIDKTRSGRSVAISIEPNNNAGDKINMFNQKDIPINASKYKEISGLDSAKFIQLAKLPENQQQRASSIEKYKEARAKTAELLKASPLDPEAIERELKFTKDRNDCYNYILTYGREQNRRLTFHPIILAAAANYSQLDIESDFVEIGQYINFSTISLSIIKTILRTSPELFIYNFKLLSSEQRKLFSTSAVAAFQYAIVILNGKPFPEGEAAIATDAAYSFEYAGSIADQLPDRRFVKGEPAIATNDEFACHYAVLIMKKPFPLGEPVIATSAEYSFDYAKAFAKQLPDNRFAAGEPAIAESYWESIEYATEVLKKPFPLGEPTILSSEWCTQSYYQKILKYHRSPSWEQLIKDDPAQSLRYARERDQPFPAGEPAILKDFDIAEAYVQEVLANRRSESWEQLIKDDPEASYSYAILLNKPFPAGEAAIAVNPDNAAYYDQQFGTNLAQQ